MFGALVKKILSGHTFVLPGDPSATRAILVQLATHIQDLESQLAAASNDESGASPSIPSRVAAPKSNRRKSSDEADEKDLKALSDEFDQLSVSVSSSQVYKRHYGQSSLEMFLMNALDVGKELHSEDRPIVTEWQSIFEKQYKRPEFWTNPWHILPSYTPYQFPDQDLLWKLLDIYFNHHAPVYPLLHRPSFERSLVDGLHYRNRDFGNLVLMICSLASRFMDDPRNLPHPTSPPQSAGWRWFNQIRYATDRDVREPVSLHRIQMLALSCYFLHATATYDAAWVSAGIGLKFSQERGAHRKDGPKPKKPTNAFNSMLTGRPRATTFEDYDLEYLTECDEEYWENEDPDKAFVQPEGTPSRMAYWNHYIKFAEIVGFAQRLVYPLRRPETKLTRAEWNKKAVAEVDTAMKKWLDAIPDHLKWEPGKKHAVFFMQSAVLYSIYHGVMIQIYRNFIPAHGQPSPLNAPALPVCVNSARSLLHIMHTVSRRGERWYGNFVGPIFLSAVILLVNIWRGMKEGSDFNTQEEMNDVHILMAILRSWEISFFGAGRMGDMLRALIASINGHIFADSTSSPAPEGQNNSSVPTADSGWQPMSYTQNQGIDQSLATFSDDSSYHQFENATVYPYGSPSHPPGAGGFNVHANGIAPDSSGETYISRLSYPTSQSYATYFQQRFFSHPAESYPAENPLGSGTSYTGTQGSHFYFPPATTTADSGRNSSPESNSGWSALEQVDNSFLGFSF
ncbi:hypothetical protein D9758_017922 [Tetrapyrgos nigripes]|uniref:Xylanolytic transcriptional activator regulatory domain-containing protein n=1 Tax=Tetrapyrgos nigripes TaxID=182062 RepID=A0A8H5B0M0_9AGAR|nr:hypothetical protein D9758_017922 [Tetrapyrgos nigripes]